MNAATFRGIAFVAFGLLLALTTALAQMSQSEGYMPPPDPGYGLYYHGDHGLIEQAIRWGYHEGWKQGREDRDRGHEADPKGSENYRRAPEHRNNPGLSREQYRRVYRNAFVRGYEHGYRL